MNKLRALYSSYVLGIIALFFYSFTQVDLSLTLSKASIFQLIEKQFQYIGFYQRPLSALILSLILIDLFICFLFFVYFSKKGILKIRQIIKLNIFTGIILTLSYTAFSYDLFNYIFDAKIISFYNQNPYLQKALDFPNDPMLNFMRWTHRVYPYGPSWLILTTPLSYLGFGFFLPTFFLFKALMGVSYLGSCYLIYQISKKIFPAQAVLNTVFFAFNPLVLIECLVSSHNDIPMIFFLLLSIYLFLQKRKVLSLVSNIFSIGVKFSTGFLFPLFLVLEIFQKLGKKINWEKFFVAALVLSLATVVVASLRTNFQTWYLIFPLAIAAFIINRTYLFLASFIASFFAAFSYVPYVYLSDYAKEYPEVLQTIQLTGLILLFAFLIIYPIFINFFRKR